MMLHPLSSSSLPNLVRLFGRYGCAPRYLPRATLMALACLLRQPLAILESVCYRRKLKVQTIDPPPIFIVGHWRSGTTHLQNLLSQDPQFGRVTLLQASMPNDFLLMPEIVADLLQRLLPKKRLMDEVPVSVDAPWEEEMALASTGMLSFYHVSFFPKHIEKIFDRAVMLKGGDPNLVAEWRRQYLAFLSKVQFAQSNKQLLLKNPANTARIPLLQAMFPGARFIHIHRNPYKVFASTIHLYLSVQREWGLQSPNRNRVVQHILRSYPLLMAAWIRDRDGLGAGHFTELSFSELQGRPLKTLQDIYTALGLDGFDAAQPYFQRYLTSQQDYRKNCLELSGQERQQASQQWHSIFDQLGYPI